MQTDPDAVLALLKDPNLESQQIAEATGTPREDAARAARLVLGMARATKPSDAVTLPPVLGLAVLRAAHAAARADVVAALAGGASKEVAKEAKRCLHLMRARGMAVPEPPRAAAPPPMLAPEPPAPCYASSIDGHGERAVWVARTVPGKGLEVAQAVVSDQHGIVELQVGLLGRKEYRNFGKDIAARGRNMGIVEVERAQAVALVAAARRLNDAAGKPPPAGADAWLARLGPVEPLADPAQRFPPLADDEERAALADSGALHDLPLLRGWLADEDALRALAQKLDEIAVSPIYLDERQRAEGSARAVADAVASCFSDPERRARWAARLFSVAAHLADSGELGHARRAAAAARALARGDDVASIPFARLLVEKAFPAEPASPPDAAAPLLVGPR
jgi:hypothetical protein